MDANIAGYIVWYGNAPGKYSAQVDAGLLLQYSVDGLADGATYCFAVQAYDGSGAKSELSTAVCGATPDASTPPDDGPLPDPEPPPDDSSSGDPPPVGDGIAGDVVLYASNAALIRGNWAAAASAGAAGGRAMRSVDRGWSAPNAPLPAPSDYFEMTFTATANTPYMIWLRLRATGNSKWNDAVWVQFSDSLVGGKAKYRIGTNHALLVNLERCEGCGMSAWGWQNGAYWLRQPSAMTFASSGTHTIRVQIREDGVEIDQILLSPSRHDAPGRVTNDTTILPEFSEVDPSPDPDPEPDPAPAPIVSEIVMHATDAQMVRGNWAKAASAGAAGGKAMRSADKGWATPDSARTAPEHYFELTFDAAANTPYRVWLRLRAGSNSKWNDAVWLQFSDALVNGRPGYRIGTAEGLAVNLEGCDGCGVSGWGWQNTAYWLPQFTVVTFAQSGSHTIRVQTREDGVEIDQVVLSPVKYLAIAPGPLTNDSTILAGTGSQSALTAPFNGTPITLPGTLDAAYFDHGEAGTAYADTTPGNTGGVFRNTDVDLQASSVGGHNIAWTVAGEWVAYTVNVQSAGTYTATFRVASRGGGAVQIGAGAPSNSARDVAVPDTRDSQSWTTVSVPIALAAGRQTITVRFLAGEVSLRAIVFRN